MSMQPEGLVLELQTRVNPETELDGLQESASSASDGKTF